MPAPRAGFALITTLFLLAAVTILALGLFGRSALEVRTSSSYSRAYQAELALDHGLRAASMALLEQTQNDDYLVVAGSTGTDPAGRDQRYLSTARYQSGQWQSRPLYSTAATTPAPATSLAPPVPVLGSDTTTIECLPHQWRPEVDWIVPTPIPVVDDAGTPVSQGTGNPMSIRLRYAFWIEDLQGYLDGEVAGNAEATGGAHRRNGWYDRLPGINANAATSGQPLDRIALYALFDPAATIDTNANDDALFGNRSYLLSPESYREVLTALDFSARTASGPEEGLLTDLVARDAEENLATGLPGYLEGPVVPFGMGYSLEGQPRMNLNKIVADRDIDGMATHVTQNLPSFASKRNPKFRAGQSYLKTLAAEAIDYADTDHDPIIGSDHRGIDSAPLVSELYLRYSWFELTRTGGKIHVKVDVTPYVELWNMSNRDVPASSYTLEYGDRCQVVFEGSAAGNFGPTVIKELSHLSPVVSPSVTGGKIAWPAQSTALAANEYRVLTFRTGFGGQQWGAVYDFENLMGDQYFVTARLSNDDGRSNYRISRDGALVDTVLGDGSGRALERKDKNLYFSNTTRSRLSNTIPGHSYGGGNYGSFVNNLGDPRGAYWINSVQAANSHRGISPGGHNNRHHLDYSPDRIYSEVFMEMWPDGAHPSAYGHDTGSNENYKDPGSYPSIPAEPDKAVQRISNGGRFYSETELGNLFDPLLWYPGSTSTTNFEQYRDIDTESAAHSNNDRYCGGSTLRIGRPEHTHPDFLGNEAWRLLDLVHVGRPFSATPAEVTGQLVERKGHVNLNTASADTLRALLAGDLAMDPAILVPAGVTSPLRPPMTTEAADEMVDRILAYRNAKPFLSPTELMRIGWNSPTGTLGASNPSAFGSMESYGGVDTAADPKFIRWNDAIAEELFGRIYNASTVRSRNFRIFVKAQTLSRNGTPLATRTRLYQVHLAPVRDANGAIVSQEFQVVYERDL